MKNILRSTSTAAGKSRNVLCVLVGAAALVLKKHYAGPGEQLVRGYGGNNAASPPGMQYDIIGFRCAANAAH